MVLFPTLRHMEKLRLPMANGALLSKYTKKEKPDRSRAFRGEIIRRLVRMRR